MRFWPLFLVLLLAPCIKAQGTYTAASCAYSDVNAIANGPTHVAVPGDTLVVPNNSGSTHCNSSSLNWGGNTPSDTGLIISVPVTLKCDVQGACKITDNTYKGTASCTMTGTPLVGLTAGNSSFETRMYGFVINANPAAGNCGESNENILVSGGAWNTCNTRVDDNTFNAANYVVPVSWLSSACGVNDHNTFVMQSLDAFAVHVNYASLNGVGYWGDESWALADTLGQIGAVYIETNTFTYSNNPSGIFPVGCFDGEFGARIVFRFNTGCPFVGVHGLDSSGRARSARTYEIYNNSFLAQENPNGNMYTGVFLRGGTGVVFNNNFVDTGQSSPYQTLVQVTSYRSTTNDYPPWGISYTGTGCDGRGPFDTNDGTTYVTGTYTGTTSANTLSMVDSSKSWTTNQWVGYSVVNLSETVNGTSTYGALILSNTSNTLTLAVPTQGYGAGTGMPWTNGDSYEILRSTACADQVGRGVGLLVKDTSDTNGIPVLNSTGNPGPVNQASDPLYAWLNKLDGVLQTAIVSNQPPAVLSGRDYIDAGATTNACNGTGVLANRPLSCPCGNIYWATDQGIWNQSGSGGQGVLYIYSSSAWSVQYTPFTYPHPLVTTPSANGSWQFTKLLNEKLLNEKLLNEKLLNEKLLNEEKP